MRVRGPCHRFDVLRRSTSPHRLTDNADCCTARGLKCEVNVVSLLTYLLTYLLRFMDTVNRRRFRIDTRSVAWELIPLFGPLSRRGLNPIKLVYDPDWPDGWLNLTASAFNQLGQYTSSPGRRGYCYAETRRFLP